MRDLIEPKSFPIDKVRLTSDTHGRIKSVILGYEDISVFDLCVVCPGLRVLFWVMRVLSSCRILGV